MSATGGCFEGTILALASADESKPKRNRSAADTIVLTDQSCSLDHRGAPRLIEVLASEGYLTPQEADTARAAISGRNFAVHGGLDPVIDQKLLTDFIAVLETVACFLPKA